MEKKKLCIELPKGGMSDLTKQVRNHPLLELPDNASEWQRFTHYLEEFKNVSEHGECVWLLKEVKREVERVKFEIECETQHPPVSECHHPCVHQRA